MLKALVSAGKANDVGMIAYPVTPTDSSSALLLEDSCCRRATCLLRVTPREKATRPEGSVCLLKAKGSRKGPISNAALI